MQLFPKTGVKKKMSFKAPIAMRLADELMNLSVSLPIEEGIEKELSYLPTIFSTEDAKEGLLSVGGGRPSFKNK